MGQNNMMKTKLLLSFLLFNLYFALDARVVEITILENHEIGVQVGLYGTLHGIEPDIVAKEQFSKIYRNMLQNKTPLLVLHEGNPFLNYNKVVTAKPWVTFLMQTPYAVESVLEEYTLPSSNDLILNRIGLLNFYKCFPRFATYLPIDYRLYAYCMDPFRRFSKDNFIIKYLKLPDEEKSKIAPGESRRHAQIEEDYFLRDFASTLSFFKKELFKETPFDLLLNRPSLVTLILILKAEIQRIKNFIVPENIKDLFLAEIAELEKIYFGLQKYCRENFTEDELKMSCSRLIGLIVSEINQKKFLAIKHIALNMSDDANFATILDLEALYRVYTTKQRKIAFFAGWSHTINLAQWLQGLGWNVSYRKEYDYRKGAPLSDFDFLK